MSNWPHRTSNFHILPRTRFCFNAKQIPANSVLVAIFSAKVTEKNLLTVWTSVMGLYAIEVKTPSASWDFRDSEDSHVLLRPIKHKNKGRSGLEWLSCTNRFTMRTRSPSRIRAKKLIGRFSNQEKKASCFETSAAKQALACWSIMFSRYCCFAGWTLQLSAESASSGWGNACAKFPETHLVWNLRWFDDSKLAWEMVSEAWLHTSLR